jgi:hypothetical protein
MTGAAGRGASARNAGRHATKDTDGTRTVRSAATAERVVRTVTHGLAACVPFVSRQGMISIRGMAVSAQSVERLATRGTTGCDASARSAARHNTSSMGAPARPAALNFTTRSVKSADAAASRWSFRGTPLLNPLPLRHQEWHRVRLGRTAPHQRMRFCVVPADTVGVDVMSKRQ